MSENELLGIPTGDKVSYGYFCGIPEFVPYVSAEEWSKNFVEKNKDLLKRLADK